MKILTMTKWLAVLGVLGAVAYAQWAASTFYRAPDPALLNSVNVQQELQITKESGGDAMTRVMAATSKARQSMRTITKTMKIACRVCGGRRMITRNGENRMCPACTGKGYRMLEIISGNVICPNCGGSGYMMGQKKKTGQQLEHCPLCLGNGQVQE